MHSCLRIAHVGDLIGEERGETDVWVEHRRLEYVADCGLSESGAFSASVASRLQVVSMITSLPDSMFFKAFSQKDLRRMYSLNRGRYKDTDEIIVGWQASSFELMTGHDRLLDSRRFSAPKGDRGVRDRSRLNEDALLMLPHFLVGFGPFSFTSPLSVLGFSDMWGLSSREGKEGVGRKGIVRYYQDK